MRFSFYETIQIRVGTTDEIFFSTTYLFLSGYFKNYNININTNNQLTVAQSNKVYLTNYTQ